MSWIIPTIATKGVAAQYWEGAEGVQLSTSINWRLEGIPERYRDNILAEWLKDVPIRHLVPKKPKDTKKSFVRLADYNRVAKQAQALMKYLTRTWKKAVYRQGWALQYKPGKSPIITTEIQPIRSLTDITGLKQFIADVPYAGWEVLEGTGKVAGKVVGSVAKATVKAAASGIKAGLNSAGIKPDDLNKAARKLTVFATVTAVVAVGGVAAYVWRSFK